MCDVCGEQGRITDLSIIIDPDGTMRSTLTEMIVLRCPLGHLFTKPNLR